MLISKSSSIFKSIIILSTALSISQAISNCNLAGETLLCKDFKNFDELKFDNIIPVRNTTIKYITFITSNENGVYLNNSLDLTNLKNVDDNYEVIIKKLNGLELINNPFAEMDATKKYSLILEDSKFEILLNGEQILVDKCNYLLENEILISLPVLASSISLIDATYAKVGYCQVFFKEANMNSFEMSNINPVNFFTFMRNAKVPDDFKSNIKNFNIYGSDFILDDGILDKNVFKNTVDIKIKRSYLRNIQSSLFESFHKLRSLKIEIFDFSTFIVFSSWLPSLNIDINVNLNDMNDFNNNKNQMFTLYLADLNKTYEFPEQDLCLFKEFPHQKLVVPIIDTKENLPCSCTLLWLLKYKKLYDSNGKNVLDTPSTHTCINIPYFEEAVSQCNLGEKLSNCYKEATSTASNESKNDNSLLIATIILSILAATFFVLFVFSVYFFKFRNRSYNDQIGMKNIITD